MKFKKRKTQFFDWLDNSYDLKKDLTLDTSIKLIGISIPIYGIVYLTVFYNYFGIQYYLYFNPLDFFQVLYKNNSSLLIACLTSSLITFLLLVIPKSFISQKWNKLVLTLIALLPFFLWIFWDESLFSNYRRAWIALMITASLGLLFSIVYKKSIKNIFYTTLFMFLWSGLILANHHASQVGMLKPKMDVVLSDGSFVLRQNSTRHSYFIGSTINYVFIYDDTIGKMRAIAKSNVKEFRFIRRIK